MDGRLWRMVLALFVLGFVVPNSSSLSGDSATYHLEAGVGVAGGLNATSVTYSLDLFGSEPTVGSFDPPSFFTCFGSLCIVGPDVPAPSTPSGTFLTISVSSPANATYSNNTPPALAFTVQGSAASYLVNYTLDGVNVTVGTVANNTLTTVNLGTPSVGQHAINVTAANGTQNLFATSNTVFFSVFAAACLPAVDPTSAPAQCALNFNVTSPQLWSLYSFNASVSLQWLAYSAATGQLQADACVNATFENTTLFTVQDAVGTTSFRANVSGTPKLTLTAYRNGCAPVTREVYLYVRRPGATIVGFPEVPWWLALPLALAALALLRRKVFKARPPR